MGQSLVQIYVHVVFSTRDRAPLISPGIRTPLFGFLGEFLNRAGCPCVAVGGVADHVHLVFRLGKGVDIQHLVGDLKSRSSLWVKESYPGHENFYWQRGYAAYSLSNGHVDAARRYVQDQEQHHRQESFADELRRILGKNGIEFDERYVWD